MVEKNNGRVKRVLLFIIGTIVLILGITFILAWWNFIVVLLKGSLGIIFALVGLFMLYAASKM
ncbi:MAG: hypothetical protein HQL26_11015 [Candidatus Omnitrophica bacterium]|nr:hypothetical protein [Candidatus Omnitrophota bacterium]